jgi:hypothetical protein
MKPAKRLSKALFALLITGELLVSSLAVVSTTGPQTPGQALGGLQISISLDQNDSVKSKAPTFRVELRNTGKDDLILNLGFMLGNGRAPYPDAVVLVLRDAQGKSRLLSLIGPPGVAGRTDPLVVPLPVDSIFALPVDLDRYWAAAAKEFDYKLTPGTYSIEAQFTGISVRWVNPDEQGIGLMPYWNGTIRSNSLGFEVPRRVR